MSFKRLRGKYSRTYGYNKNVYEQVNSAAAELHKNSM